MYYIVILFNRQREVQRSSDVHPSLLYEILVNLLYMCMSGEFGLEREKFLIRILINYETLVTSENEVQQWLKERV